MHRKDPPNTTEEKLDVIIEYLHHLDRRDRMRMIGGTIRGIVSLIPVIFFIAGMWYLYMYGDELMAKIARQAAEQAAEVTKQGSETFMQQFQEIIGR